jgi:hypothetical protein
MRNYVYNHFTDGEIGQVISNHDVTQPGTIGEKAGGRGIATERELAITLGLFSYTMRVVSVAERGIIQLPSVLCEAYDWVDREHNETGLKHRYDEVIFEDDFSLANVPELAKARMSVFFFGDGANGVRPDQIRLEATRRFNDKTYVTRLAWKLGVATPFTINYQSVNQVDISRCPYLGAIKIGESVSGLGFIRYFGRDDLSKKLCLIPQNVNFQIQEFMPGADFLSFQWFVDDWGFAWPVTGTCNFIEGEANHQGNWGGYMIPHEALENFTRPMVMEAVRQGVKGWMSFDVALYNGNFYLIECNPRFSGAAYIFIPVVRALGYKKALNYFWAGKTYAVSKKRISQIDLGSKKYNPKKEEGWLVTNAGPAGVGGCKMGLVYIGSPDKYSKSEDELKWRLAA